MPTSDTMSNASAHRQRLLCLFRRSFQVHSICTATITHQWHFVSMISFDAVLYILKQQWGMITPRLTFQQPGRDDQAVKNQNFTPPIG